MHEGMVAHAADQLLRFAGLPMVKNSAARL